MADVSSVNEPVDERKSVLALAPIWALAGACSTAFELILELRIDSRRIAAAMGNADKRRGRRRVLVVILMDSKTGVPD